MLSLRFDIKNPFWKDRYNKLFRNYVCISKSIAENKTFDFEIYRNLWDIFVFHIDLVWYGSDHAGPKFVLNILGYEMVVSIEDNRHWNDRENRWVDYSNLDEAKYWG